MAPFFNIIKLDYLQRTRSYAFLITLCASLVIAYSFVPEPNSNYSTIRISGYVGYYNAAWFGYVTAIMTSFFLSLIGFYLINSGLKKDIETKVGQIIASTSISNFKYLLAKTLSNFLILSTIVGVVFIMSIILFVLYNEGYSFELYQFIKPYLLITIPTMFLISVIAVVFEVFLGRFSVLQNIGYFFLFSALITFTPINESEFNYDLFGSKIVIHQLEEMVRELTITDENSNLSIGYILSDIDSSKKFLFNGMDFSMSFIISRFIWVVLGFIIIAIISPFFHRFNMRKLKSTKKLNNFTENEISSKNINLLKLPKAQINYSILPLIKTELILLFRKGKKWLWLINLLGMLLLVVLPLKVSHQIVLPVLWFLQVSRLSDLTSKEITNNLSHFVFTSYKPLGRLLLSQVSAAVILMLLLAFPLIIRLGLLINFEGMLAIIFGGVIVVMVAALLGIISKGKKLFEVLFFMITYANINLVLFVDYFGALKHHKLYVIQLAVLGFLLLCASLLIKKNQLEND
ncbi:hypothetical protein [Dokdonia sp. R78006]|uniref:hypothetical protein n=1 Tax=Dokdonia sp. R78006 TaxID=3093866 RepID=UPI0036D3FD8C